MIPLKQKLSYKWFYYKRKIWRFFGYCEKCGEKMNYTTSGRPICPECSR